MDPTTKIGILVICTLFVSAIMHFAHEYLRLYQKDARHFAFNADVFDRQRESVRLELEGDLLELQANIGHLQELVEALSKKEVTALAESAPGQAILRSGRRYEFQVCGGTPGVGWQYTSVAMYDQDDKKQVIGLINRPYGDPVREEFFLEIAREASTNESLRRIHIETRLTSLPSCSPQMWGIWDFLYFSTVIQTTIGLGDILPNSSRVRKLVVLQVLIGYGLLIVALGIVLSSKH